MSLLEKYGGKEARTKLLARHPELAGIIDVTGSLLREQAAGGFGLAEYRIAANITEAFRRVIGAVGDNDGQMISVDEHIALCRLKRGVRDAALTFPWPYTPAGSGGTTIILSDAAHGALARILAYDSLLDYSATTGPNYNGITNNLGDMLVDISVLATGYKLNRKVLQ